MLVVAFGGALGFGDDEASADGVEDFFGEDCAGAVEGGEAHAVGVRVDGSGSGYIWLRRKLRFSASVKGTVLRPASLRELVDADGGDFCFDGGGVDGVGGFAEEAEEDGAVGAVADAGEGERAVEVDVDLCGFFEEVCGGEFAGEAEGGSHGAYGVGAGGADADFEEFEEAGVHGGYCRGRRGVLAGVALRADLVGDFFWDFFCDCFSWRLW